MDLKTFLLARIAEDEDRNNPDPDPSGSCDYLHGVHYDSARVLAECAAKRAIIELHAPISLPGVKGKEAGCPLCGNYERGYGWETAGPCGTLRALAAVYADHPDYQPEWAASS